MLKRRLNVVHAHDHAHDSVGSALIKVAKAAMM
jgi:hypothetical protein